MSKAMLRWEMKIPVLSTSHVKQNTFQRLEAGKQICEYEEGAFVYVPGPDDENLQDYYPEELLPVIQWFHTEYPNERWFRFDRDGDIIEGLPTYDW